MRVDMMSRLWQAGLVALGLSVACGASTSRNEPDAAAPSSAGGSKSGPTGGDEASTGGADGEPGGGSPDRGGAPSAGASGSGGATSMSGGSGDAGSGGSGGIGAAGSGGGGGGDGPVRDRCVNPWPLELVDGRATVSGDTSRATDEFPALSCAVPPLQPSLRGGQLYYRFKARPGRVYALGLEAGDFSSADFYVFPAAGACTEDSIRAACSSNGATGTRRKALPSKALTPFAPSEPGDYIIGVDTTSTRGTPFTLSVFEYCGASGGTDCKLEGCDLGAWRTCVGNTVSACNDDGTATVTTDCTTTGESCHRGFCVDRVNDLIGSTWPTSAAMSAGAAGVTLLDFYEAATSRTITELEIIMVQPRVFTLDWRILEAKDRAGPYRAIFTKTTMSAGAMQASGETTGPIQVPIQAGRFYAIGVALPAEARYYLQLQAEKSLPVEVSFGQLTSAAVVQSAAASDEVAYPTPDNFVLAQRITTKL